MSKTPQVVFHPKRIAEGDWQIEAHFPGAEIRYITGLTDKADIDDWIGIFNVSFISEAVVLPRN